MGNWVVVVEGTGAHHNPVDHYGDADAAFKKFVAGLVALGQTVEHATITFGGRENYELDYAVVQKDV